MKTKLLFIIVLCFYLLNVSAQTEGEKGVDVYGYIPPNIELAPGESYNDATFGYVGGLASGYYTLVLGKTGNLTLDNSHAAVTGTIYITVDGHVWFWATGGEQWIEFSCLVNSAAQYGQTAQITFVIYSYTSHQLEFSAQTTITCCPSEDLIFDTPHSFYMDVNLVAQNSITFEPGYQWHPANSAYELSATIQGCGSGGGIGSSGSLKSSGSMESDNFNMNDNLKFSEIEPPFDFGFQKELLTISPNPSNGKFQVITNMIGSNMKIYNMTGDLIFSKENNTDPQQIVDIGNAPAGIYILMIYNQNNMIKKKLLIQ